MGGHALSWNHRGWPTILHSPSLSHISLNQDRSVLGNLRGRFRIRRVIVVSDRGTVSQENLKLFSSLGLSYIVGVRMRRVREVEKEILSRPGRYLKVAENLKVKEVRHQGKRYIV